MQHLPHTGLAPPPPRALCDAIPLDGARHATVQQRVALESAAEGRAAGCGKEHRDLVELPGFERAARGLEALDLRCIVMLLHCYIEPLRRG